MSKFTAVVPMQWMITPPHKDFIGTLPSRILILAHDVLNPKYSQQDVSESLQEFEGDIILDNSASEKVPLYYEQLLEAVTKIGKNRGVELALPDVLENGEETLCTSLAFMDYVKDNFDAFGLTSFMFIPQGDTIEDFTACMRRASQIKYFTDNINCIGIPRNIVPRLFPTREYAVALANTFFTVSIHLLGFADTLDDITLSNCPMHDIRSIDSAVPLRASVRNIALSTDVNVFIKGCKNAGPRMDWFENPTFSELVLHNLEAATEIFKETN